MLEPISFKDAQGIKIEKLKEEMQRRISKISWLVDKRLKNPSRHPEKLIYTDLIDFGMQTDSEICQSTPRSFGMTASLKAMEASMQTKLSSKVGVGINTEFSSSQYLPSIANIATEVSIEGIQSQLETPHSAKHRYQQIQFLKHVGDSRDFPIVKESSDKAHSRVVIKESGEVSPDDSLDNSLSKKNIEHSRDEKFFSTQNLQESLMISKMSHLSSNLSDERKEKRCSIEKINKENDSSRSLEKTKNHNRSRSKTNRSRQPEGKAKLDIRGSEKRHIKTEVVEDERKNSCERESEFSASFLHEGAALRNTVHVASDVKSRKTINPSRITTERKPAEKTEKTQKKQKPERIIVSSSTKQKMKNLVKDIIPGTRKEANDGTVRANLLKRIEDKHKVNKL